MTSIEQEQKLSELLSERKKSFLFVSPFCDLPGEEDRYSTDHGGYDWPRTTAERQMIKLSAAVRSKPKWYEKMKRYEILKKWRQEAIKNHKMSNDQINYVFDELHYYKKLIVTSGGKKKDEKKDIKKNGKRKGKDVTKSVVNNSVNLASAASSADAVNAVVQMSGVDGVWKGENMLESELVDTFLGQLAAFGEAKEIKDGGKDWHPGSNDQVLNYVHPSLFCLVLDDVPDQTDKEEEKKGKKNKDDRKKKKAKKEKKKEKESREHHYQWLPAEFRIEEYKENTFNSLTQVLPSVTIESPINNLDPEEKSASTMYPTIAKIFAHFIPLFERVMSNSLKENNTIPIKTDKVDDDKEEGKGNLGSPEGKGNLGSPYLFHHRIPPDQIKVYDTKQHLDNFTAGLLDHDESGQDEDSYDEQYDLAVDDFNENSTFESVKVPKFFSNVNTIDHLKEWRSCKPFSLSGKTLQVIVKIAEIVLTPEKPSYAGGSWHIEGTMEESICCSGIAYLESTNITESKLSFRRVTNDPPYEQNDDIGLAHLYNLSDEDMMNEFLGSVVTSTPSDKLESKLDNRKRKLDNYVDERKVSKKLKYDDDDIDSLPHSPYSSHSDDEKELKTTTDEKSSHLQQEGKEGLGNLGSLLLAFPNIFQHKVEPFELVDKSKNGHRKILVFFIVDPGVKITSTKDIPYGAGKISLKEAKEHRLKLMKERKFFTKKMDEEYFERPFSLCEH
jgi:hypothetical protein